MRQTRAPHRLPQLLRLLRPSRAGSGRVCRSALRRKGIRSVVTRTRRSRCASTAISSARSARAILCRPNRRSMTHYVRDGKLRVIFRDFPIRGAPPQCAGRPRGQPVRSRTGAPLVLGNARQAVPDAIRMEQCRSIRAPVFERLAEEAGADMDALQGVYGRLQRSQAAASIAAALAEGQAAGVSGTPSFQFVAPTGMPATCWLAPSPSTSSPVTSMHCWPGEKPPVPAGQRSPGRAQEIPFWATAEGWQPDPERPGFNMAGDAVSRQCSTPRSR